MQIGLLPTAGDLAVIQRHCGVGVAALYRSGEEVGGDFWGIWPTGKGRLAVALADFAGHGLSAALNTFRLHALLSEQTLPRGPPTRMTDLLNERLHGLLPWGQYATMVYLQIVPARRRVAWCAPAARRRLLVSTEAEPRLEGTRLAAGHQARTAPTAVDGWSFRLRRLGHVQRRPVRERRPRSGCSAHGTGARGSWTRSLAARGALRGGRPARRRQTLRRYAIAILPPATPTTSWRSASPSGPRRPDWLAQSLRGFGPARLAGVVNHSLGIQSYCPRHHPDACGRAKPGNSRYAIALPTMMWNRTASARRARGTSPGHQGGRAPPLPQAPPKHARQGEAVEALLGRWMELSELERRAFLAMTRELAATSSVIEHSALDLSHRFQTLAEHARAQVVRVEAITAAAGPSTWVVRTSR